jgi:beta-lactamase regulating signal transducer with metallopeptidase domain
MRFGKLLVPNLITQAKELRTRLLVLRKYYTTCGWQLIATAIATFAHFIALLNAVFLLSLGSAAAVKLLIRRSRGAD